MHHQQEDLSLAEIEDRLQRTLRLSISGDPWIDLDASDIRKELDAFAKFP